MFDELREEYDWMHQFGRMTEDLVSVEHDKLCATHSIAEMSDETVLDRFDFMASNAITDKELDWSEVEMSEEYESHPDYDYPPEAVAKLI